MAASCGAKCPAFEAHAFLDARRAKQLPPDISPLADVALLPYSPRLVTLDCEDHPYFLSVCAHLATAPRATPNLTELLNFVSDPNSGRLIVAALENNPLLETLNLGIDGSFIAVPAQPRLQLPPLRALIDLHLQLPVTGDSVRAWLPLHLDTLTSMRQLTSLRFHLDDLRNAEALGAVAPKNEVFAAAAMLPMASALAFMPALRSLTLLAWTCARGPAVNSSWHALSPACATSQACPSNASVCPAISNPRT